MRGSFRPAERPVRFWGGCASRVLAITYAHCAGVARVVDNLSRAQVASCPSACLWSLHHPIQHFLTLLCRARSHIFCLVALSATPSVPGTTGTSTPASCTSSSAPSLAPTRLVNRGSAKSATGRSTCSPTSGAPAVRHKQAPVLRLVVSLGRAGGVPVAASAAATVYWVEPGGLSRQPGSAAVEG